MNKDEKNLIYSRKMANKTTLNHLKDDLVFSAGSASSALAIEATLRTESLLDLSKLIVVDTNFISDLNSIYKNIRFSIDLDSCILLRFVNGVCWEYMLVVNEHKFINQCQWLAIENDQYNEIEALFDMRKELIKNTNKNTEEQSDLEYILSQDNTHLERFRHEHGGVVFKASGKNKYSQYDKAYLSNVAAIISFCVDIDISSHYLDSVYQNLQTMTNRLHEDSSTRGIAGIAPVIYLDTETGLYNKSGFLRIVRHCIDISQSNFYVVIISIEKLGYFFTLFDEKIKQNYLKHVINHIKTVITDNTTLSYLGSNELAFVMVNSNTEEIRSVLSRIMNLFLDVHHVDEYKIRFDLKAGYSCYPSSATNSEALLKMASIALFQANKCNKERFVGYEDGMVQELKLHIELARSIRKAIERNEFVIYFQPITKPDYSTTIISHYEALIRWQHPEKGIISPVNFIEIAESNGDIIPLGYWLVEKVCYLLSLPYAPDSVGVSINISPVQLREANLVDKITQILNQYSISSNRITIEITETSAMLDSDLTKERFSEFHAAGFKLSMDDFGTGYSSLSYLLNFPFDILKIDKSFIDNTLTDEGYEIIGKSVVKLAHDLSLSVVCEGIETEEQLRMVSEWGTDMIQGYLVSKPKPWSTFYLPEKNNL